MNIVLIPEQGDPAPVFVYKNGIGTEGEPVPPDQPLSFEMTVDGFFTFLPGKGPNGTRWFVDYDFQ